MKDYNYYPRELNLKCGVPARIVVDTNKVRGCLQSIVIPDFCIKKAVNANDKVVEFTPNKRGTFSFSCSIGTGYGKIIIN